MEKDLNITPVTSSLAKLSGSSKVIPSEKDFHFYNNFPQFNLPIKQIAQNSQSIVQTLASSDHLFGKIPYPDDQDDAYDWLVNVNDELFERIDSALDQFKGKEKDDGFELVTGRKKKKEMGDNSGVKVAVKSAAKVPFHIPSIPRPQDQHRILVNNANEAFEHVWLEKDEDGERFVHPLEEWSFSDFVDDNIGDLEPLKPPPVEGTPFILVEEVNDLKELAADLRGVDEFAVDLEHNQYRSFQGLTCLMQISTRTLDYVVDTLKLRIHIGPYLREIFKDPTKKKVMHGADSDIMWLQRDFGIYVVNMFDTGQASRVLNLERKSLEYLLKHFCDVTADKQYQNADWRLRPLPDVMLRYAREDTHYLLHIYDLMKIRLLSPCAAELGTSEAPLAEVYKRSYDICMKLYEKELLTDSSYLYIYGLQSAGFNAQQVAVVAGLHGWRDAIARAEDESTGYILPNKLLLEIAKQMPVTANKLRQMVIKHPYIERSLGSVVSIIRQSMQNASAFEAAAEQLKKMQAESEQLKKMHAENAASHEKIVVADGSEALPCDNPAENGGGSDVKNEDLNGRPLISLQENSLEPGSSNQRATFSGDNGNLKVSGAEATVLVLKKPSRAFGALLGNSASKRKFDHGKKEKEDLKLEEIKSSVNLPFHSFSGTVEELQPVVVKEREVVSEAAVAPIVTNIQDIIMLEDDSDVEEPTNGDDTTNGSNLESVKNDADHDGDVTTMSLSDLSSSFQKCLESTHQTRKGKEPEESLLELKPFDYEAARKEVKFGEVSKKTAEDSSSFSKGGKKKTSVVVGKSPEAEETGEFQPGRRRQAFPASGNRSATFR